MMANIRTVSKEAALAHFESVASINLTNGKFLVEEGAAVDHAQMRADQLSSLLLLMRLDDGRNFRNISDDRQLHLMWLASQMANELNDLLPVIVEEVRQEKKA